MQQEQQKPLTFSIDLFCYHRVRIPPPPPRYYLPSKVSHPHYASCTNYDCIPPGIWLCLLGFGWFLLYEWLPNVSAVNLLASSSATSSSSFDKLFHGSYHRYLVIQARKKYGVEYPWLYAPESNKNHKEFNSAQRAHQNTLESFSFVMLQMCMCGLVYPITSAICGEYSCLFFCGTGQ